MDAKEIELAHGSDEEPLLFDIDDSLIGDDPDIEVVVYPDEEGEDPEENEEHAFDKGEESSIESGECVRINEEKENEYRENGYETEYEGNKLHEYVEPVTVNHIENFFVTILTFKGAGASKFFVGRHHRREGRGRLRNYLERATGITGKGWEDRKYRIEWSREEKRHIDEQ